MGRGLLAVHIVSDDSCCHSCLNVRWSCTETAYPDAPKAAWSNGLEGAQPRAADKTVQRHNEVLDKL